MYRDGVHFLRLTLRSMEYQLGQSITLLNNTFRCLEGVLQYRSAYVYGVIVDDSLKTRRAGTKNLQNR